ncbi:hypothetical protein ACERII_18780 [Evansella sp. AB-rgal1]|uniref:hypothetical protein n=1 Tax=Evansella sp. AB-rgal1 TaxID=3242696 RepID=UPI00359E56AD
MRPILILSFIIFLGISAYYDLTEGTIPQSLQYTEDNNVESNGLETGSNEAMSIPYQEVIVEAGHTVYGIVQALHEKQGLRFAPPKVVDDFEALNPNVKAHEIIIGHTYRFPLYDNE